MKNIPAKNIQRITLMIAMLFGLNLTTIQYLLKILMRRKKFNCQKLFLLVMLEICFLLKKKLRS